MPVSRITWFPLSGRAFSWCALLFGAVVLVNLTWSRVPIVDDSGAGVAPMALDQFGAAVAQQYHGDGLAVVATPDGARLGAVFQKLEADVTSTGLAVRSTDGNGGGAKRESEAEPDHGVQEPGQRPAQIREAHCRAGGIVEYARRFCGVI